jgi:hypothetical protein
MPESLLNAALKVTRRQKKTDHFSLEEEELCLAWLNDEVELYQVSAALKKASGLQVYVFLARCSRQLFIKAQRKK